MITDNLKIVKATKQSTTSAAVTTNVSYTATESGYACLCGVMARSADSGAQSCTFTKNGTNLTKSTISSIELCLVQYAVTSYVAGDILKSVATSAKGADSVTKMCVPFIIYTN